MEDYTPFDLVKQTARYDERSSDLVMQLSYEVNFDQKVISRSGYTLLDVLSDVGGFLGVLTSIFAFILSLFNFNNFSSHLASRFYKL